MEEGNRSLVGKLAMLGSIVGLIVFAVGFLFLQTSAAQESPDGRETSTTWEDSLAGSHRCADYRPVYAGVAYSWDELIDEYNEIDPVMADTLRGIAGHCSQGVGGVETSSILDEFAGDLDDMIDLSVENTERCIEQLTLCATHWRGWCEEELSGTE